MGCWQAETCGKWREGSGTCTPSSPLPQQSQSTRSIRALAALRVSLSTDKAFQGSSATVDVGNQPLQPVLPRPLLTRISDGRYHDDMPSPLLPPHHKARLHWCCFFAPGPLCPSKLVPPAERGTNQQEVVSNPMPSKDYSTAWSKIWMHPQLGFKPWHPTHL